MPVCNVRTKWSSGNLVFYPVSGTSGTVTFGEAGTGIDQVFIGANSTVTWDASADAMIFNVADINMGDTDYIKFGDSNDVTVNFDGTNFEIESAAAATPFNIGAASKVLNTTLHGTLTVGVNDTGYDVKFFGATAGNYMLWDESADKLIIVGSADLGTSCSADAYVVGSTSGASFTSGSITSLEVINGIVTFAA